jgi:Na+-translocating ferredoxin:NAD+ oxidoreductase RnfC subunit
MPPAGFEPTIPISNQLQAHTSDRLVTGISIVDQIVVYKVCLIPLLTRSFN